MPRPKKDTTQIPVEARIEEAFLKHIQEYQLEQVSIVTLTAEAQCNRSTFYYYYVDIYDLLSKIIEKNIPESIPKGLSQCIIGGESLDLLSAAFREEQDKIDRLCLLLNSNASALVTKQVKSKLIKVWINTLGFDEASMSQSIRFMFEFGVGGILSLLTYRGERNLEFSVEESILSLTPEFPQAFLSCFVKHKELSQESA